jgi:hypothetical protein
MGFEELIGNAYSRFEARGLVQLIRQRGHRPAYDTVGVEMQVGQFSPGTESKWSTPPGWNTTMNVSTSPFNSSCTRR